MESEVRRRIEQALSGQCAPPACEVRFNKDETATLTASPDVGRVFYEWDGDCVPTAGSCAVTMDANKGVTATFGEPLTLDIDAQPGGSVSTDHPEIICGGGGCSGTVTTYGDSVTLSAVADTDWRFWGWTGDCEGADCTLLMDGPKQVVATFGQVPKATLRVVPGGDDQLTISGPGISCPPDCDQTVEVDDTVPLDAGRRVHWDTCGFARLCSVLVEEDLTVHATYPVAHGTIYPDDDCDEIDWWINFNEVDPSLVRVTLYAGGWWKSIGVPLTDGNRRWLETQKEWGGEDTADIAFDVVNLKCRPGFAKAKFLGEHVTLRWTYPMFAVEGGSHLFMDWRKDSCG